MEKSDLTWKKKKKKKNIDKTPKQTNKQRKERQKPLTHKTTFLERKNFKYFFQSVFVRSWRKITLNQQQQRKKNNLETTWRLDKWHKNEDRRPMRESEHFNGGRSGKICYQYKERET